MINFITSLSSSGSETPLSDIEIIAMGDPQPGLTGGVQRPSPLEWVIRDSVVHADSTYPEASMLVVVGDYTEYELNASDAAKMNGIFDNWTRDKYCIPGNHDVGDKTYLNSRITTFYSWLSGSFQNIGNLFTDGYGYHKRTDNNLHVITLNSSDYTYMGFASGTPTDGSGQLSPTQLAWFQNTLNTITELNARLLIVIHYPLETDNKRAVNPQDYLIERTQRLEIFRMITKWQAESNNGLVLGVLNGHTHLNGSYEFDGHYGKVNCYTLKDSAPPNYTGYTGSELTISSQTEFMNYARIKFYGASNNFKIDGIGLQDSYPTISLNDRVTPPRELYTGTELPIIGSLTVSNSIFRLATLNCTATHSVGVEHYELWFKSTGGDLPDVPLFLQRKIYDANVTDFIIGQLSDEAIIEVYLIAVDEAGNKSVPSNTFIWGGGQPIEDLDTVDIGSITEQV